VDDRDAPVRKLGGVLGETEGLGTDDPRVVVGIGLNADWPATEFPTELAATMTSLRSASGDQPIDPGRLLDAFAERLAVRIEALFDGRFDVADWVERQITTGRRIDLVRPDDRVETVLARGVDGVGGGLRIAAPTDADAAAEQVVFVGEIRHVRLASV
jgi:biotin-(acetyl-CoA carboxylase) ligase